MRIDAQPWIYQAEYSLEDTQAFQLQIYIPSRAFDQVQIRLYQEVAQSLERLVCCNILLKLQAILASVG